MLKSERLIFRSYLWDEGEATPEPTSAIVQIFQGVAAEHFGVKGDLCQTSWAFDIGIFNNLHGDCDFLPG